MTWAFLRKHGMTLLGGMLLLGGLYATSLYSYLLFHSVVEIVSIAVAWSVFFLVWNSRRFLDNYYLLFVGMACLFIGVIDLLHTLAFKGMGVFQGSDANLATQLWIAGRYLQSISMLLAPLFLHRKLNERLVLATYGVVLTLLLASIFLWHIFPDCFVEGSGLTPFKIGSEYVITGVLLVSMGLLFFNRKEFDPNVLRHLMVSIGLTVISELAFTLYISVYDFSNLTGHLFRVLALYFLYRAIIVTGLVRPYDLLFRHLQQSEGELQTANEHLESANTRLQAEIVERKRAEESLRMSEQRVRLKLDSILSPDGDIGNLDLADIIESQAIQSFMEEFYRLAHIPMAIIDLHGRVLVGVGWQEICTQFHRVHPVTGPYCVESDTQLSAGVHPGEFRLYKCKNNMWDIATPIMLGDRHVGNVFSGQFFFEDEPVDRELFRAQAVRYGFDEVPYLAALDRVPRLSRESINQGMAFFVKLADLISKLSYGNIRLARSLAERDALNKSLQASQATLRAGEERLRKLNQELGLQAGKLQAANDNLEKQTAELQVANIKMEQALSNAQAARAEAEKGKRVLEGIQQEIQILNRDLEHRNTELATVNQELEAFSYSVSHDLRTPLASIDQFARLAIEDFGSQLAPEGKHYLGLIRDNAVAMRVLIDDLLAFSRSSRQPLKKQTVPMADLVHEVVGRLCETEGERQIEITIGDLPECLADPGLLRQVWVNLVSNALKFTRQREVARIEIGYRTDDGEPAFFIKDNGVGFDRENADRLFGVFQRYHSGDDYEGTGVGLAIVERIVHRHGGRVWAEAKTNQGATFYFS
ncbi:MAG TPA: MASE3 domain-containing protein, partial [Anaerolineae bacterium]